jgi:DNA processing protein
LSYPRNGNEEKKNKNRFHDKPKNIILERPKYNLKILNTTELHHQIALSMLSGVGPKNARLLVAYMGSPSAIFESKANLRTSVPGFSKERFRSLNRTKALVDAEKTLRFIEKNAVSTHFFTEQSYPYRLKQCPDAPVLLYSKGSPELNPNRTVALVGTRNMTPYGKKIIHELIRHLKGFNVQVVSGLAYGVDNEAHRCCNRHGLSTIGVLGHGLDRIYPHRNKKTAQDMLSAEGSGLLTEFPHDTLPDRENFPQRNRIVAGMTDATIVVESGAKGGSLITAHLANDYNRDVFAYPGNIDQDYSKGCNYLIANDKAHLITSGKDLTSILGWEKKTTSKPIQGNLFENLNGDEKKIVKLIREFEKVSLDVMSIRLKKPVSLLSGLLLGLEIKGIVMMIPGQKYMLGKI